MENSGIIALLSAILIPILLISILLIVSYWKIFTKAGKPGWAVLIPIYSTLVLLEIIRKPWWWLLLMMIPGLNIIWAIWSINLLVKSFGKDEGFTVGCILLPYVFFPILAFSKSAQYIYNTNDEVQDIGKTQY